MNIKRENFERIVGKRIEKFDNLLKTFQGLSNKQHYEYADEDVQKIVEHMYNSVDDVKKALMGKKKFSLRRKESFFVNDDGFVGSVSKFIEENCNPCMLLRYGDKDICGVVEAENSGICFVSGICWNDKWVIQGLVRNLNVSEALDLVKNYISK